uniref:Ulp1 protease family, C-terminal catalytic domain containing protein n=1 Tax=Solanum tuberosum TaxID=4113 RepID=M1DSU4_SOLTU
MTTAPISHSTPKGKEKEKEKEKEKVKKKAKEKEKKVVNCDVKQQYPFEVASPKKKDWFYVMSQPNRCWTDERLWTFVAAYAEFLSDGLQVPSDGIISQTIRMRYASLLWNYGILKAQCGYVSNNEDP